MPNVIIPLRHQSAPTQQYDPLLAREAAAAKDPVKASRQDWDAIDWETIRRRRAMVNQDWDQEWDAPEFHDPALALLEQRAYLEQIELRPEQWVEESLDLYERNCEKSRQQQLPDQQRWEGKENEDARLVNILHPNQVMRRLRAAGVDAREQEHPNARIWLNDWSARGLVGVNAWVHPEPMDEDGYLLAIGYAGSQKQKELLTGNFLACREGRRIQRTLTSLQEPYGPEWSVMRFTGHNVAHKEKFRGWRTAMLVLIVSGVLTEAEVDNAFGPATGPAAAWYRAQLQSYRRVQLGG